MLVVERTYISLVLSAVAACCHACNRASYLIGYSWLRCVIHLEFFSQINKISAGLYTVTAEILAVISR